MAIIWKNSKLVGDTHFLKREEARTSQNIERKQASERNLQATVDRTEVKTSQYSR
jgi:hypothetical protein